jgi:ABC-2 type transport system ATP-binding protein
MIAFTNALWAGFELTEKAQHDDICKATVKMLNNATPNDVLATILPHVKVISFNEVIPTMNDIFITKVNAGQNQESPVGYTE